MTRNATIVGTGHYLPPIERSNASMRERFGEALHKFEASSGITTRWYAPEDRATSELAVAGGEAGKAALKDAGYQARRLDVILLGTDRPDYNAPATSVVTQHKLGAVNAG